MNTIIAVLMYLGIATSPAEVNSVMVLKHADVIIDNVDNPNFISYYKSVYNIADYNIPAERCKTEVVIMDIEEGN
jgi:hypothetical protein